MIGARALSVEFAAELNELRAERAVSWDELARRSGVSRTYLRDLAGARSGQGIPSETVVEKIAAALEVPADHFRITRARFVLASPRAIDAVYKRLKPVA